MENKSNKKIIESAVQQKEKKPKLDNIELVFARHLAVQGMRKRDGEIYRWTGHHYALVPREEAQEIALAWLERHDPERACSRKGKASLDTALDHLPRLTLLQETCDKPRFIVPTRKFWLEIILEGGDVAFYMRKPDPAVGIVGEVPIEINGADGMRYEPSSPNAPRLTGFLASAFPVSGSKRDAIDSFESVSALQEFAGYTMLQGGPALQKALLLQGGGGNGKGVFVKIVQRFHPQKAALRVSQLGGRFALFPLVGATLATVDEMTEGDFDQGVLKSLISGDSVPFERKGKDVVAAFCSQAKWILCSNLSTGIRSFTPGEGIWRRLIMIQWKHAPTNPIPDLDKVIFDTEGSAVLDWMLIGLKRVVSAGCLFEPSSAKEFKDNARLASDSVLGWSKDIGGDFAIRVSDILEFKDDVYADYEKWCETHGHRSVVAQVFWTRLKGIYGHGKIVERQRKDPKLNRIRSCVNLDISRQFQPSSENDDASLPPSPDQARVDAVFGKMPLPKSLVDRVIEAAKKGMSLNDIDEAAFPF